MLTIADDSTIRNAIWKRLYDPERGVILHKFDDIGLRKAGNAIHIQLTIYVQPIPGFESGEVLRLRSGITAPLAFDHGRLLNEIDEVAEAIKAARRKHNGTSVNILNDDVQLAGNG